MFKQINFSLCNKSKYFTDMNSLFRNALPAVIAILLFILISAVYMAPALSGKRISQHDIVQFQGQSKEVVDHRVDTGEEALWTNSMFGGMPAYLISTLYPSNNLKEIHTAVNLFGWRPISFLFVYMLCFYLALLAFKVNPWLAIAGALAYAFASFTVISIVAGHNAKVVAIGYMPAIIGGIHLVFRKKYIWGALLTGIALGLQILIIHLQITYYTLIAVLLYGFFELIWAIKEKTYKELVTAIGILTVAVLLAVGSNMGNMLTTIEYGKHSIRGKSELTSDQENRTSGLDKDYATRWSYGKWESFTLLIPNFHGGASAGELPQNSRTFEFLSQVQGKANAKKAIKQMPTYWGTQPGTSGPVYVGAIICFLFVLGLFIVDPKLRWWLLSATIVSLLLAWGKNIPNLTNFLLDNLPGYNKFRSVSMTLVIAGVAMPLMAVLAFDKVLKKEVNKKDLLKALKYAYGITAGLTVFFILFAGGLFDFESPMDQNYLAQGYTEFVDALQADRAMLLRKDALRSLIFISLGAGLIFFYLKEKIQAKYAILALGTLLIFDLWPIDKRYLNESNFIPKKKHSTPFTPSVADQYILQDPALDYRVVNLTTDPFNDASTSYYHKSIGGYHGAKMRRYQEVIEKNIGVEIQRIGSALQSQDFGQINQALASSQTLNMLNTKYFIFNPQAQPLENTSANGNAWFVNNYRIVENADEEIATLGRIDTKFLAIIDKRFEDHVDGKNFVSDSLANIKLVEYKPNYLKYSTQASSEQLAVFAEIYYPEGWKVTIDGEPADHFRANYILRAMTVPAGEHVVEFKFEPKSYYMGEKISLISSLLLIALLIGAAGWEVKNLVTKKEE